MTNLNIFVTARGKGRDEETIQTPPKGEKYIIGHRSIDRRDYYDDAVSLISQR